MKNLSLSKVLGCAIGAAGLLLSNVSASAAEIYASAGTTFVLTQTATNKSVFTHSVDGVVQVSHLGNCTVHFDVLVTAVYSDLFGLKGTLTITNATGASTLKANVEGYGMLETDNQNFLDIHYEVTFTGGTGKFANATGQAAIDGFALFTTQGLAQPTGAYATGKATWTMKGQVQPVRANHWLSE